MTLFPLQLRAVNSLVYSMGNVDYADSQRQACIATEVRGCTSSSFPLSSRGGGGGHVFLFFREGDLLTCKNQQKTKQNNNTRAQGKIID